MYLSEGTIYFVYLLSKVVHLSIECLNVLNKTVSIQFCRDYLIIRPKILQFHMNACVDISLVKIVFQFRPLGRVIRFCLS